MPPSPTGTGWPSPMPATGASMRSRCSPACREALEALEDAGLLLGVATGKSRRGLVATLDSHGLLDRFCTLQTSDTGPGKPHPDMVFRALAEAGVDASDTVVIGDTSFDMLMAGSARTGAVGVAWGYHEVEELTGAGAQRICLTTDEVPAAVLDLLGLNPLGVRSAGPIRWTPRTVTDDVRDEEVL